MAIHPELHASSPSQGHLTPQQSRAISAWTDQATASLEDLTLTDSVTAGTSARSAGLRGAAVPLTIPLDDPVPVSQQHPATTASTEQTSVSRVRLVTQSGVHATETSPKVPTVSFRRREPLRRDSLRRREALQKGKDGSRRRQRWENDRLLHNPWAEPPSPNDWAIQPTYPRHDPVPYYLAPLWDVHYSHLDQRGGGKIQRTEKHQIPKELRRRLKHARAARGMLQNIEEDIRTFIHQWNQKQLLLRQEGLQDAPQSGDEDEKEDSDDEVVFVGRGGQMHDSPTRKTRFREIREAMSTHNERDGEKMVFESSVEDRAAGFGRWLVHSIASYYGLHTWSVTVGESARREAYVGFYPPAPDRHGLLATTCGQESMVQPGEDLPLPLWTQV